MQLVSVAGNVLVSTFGAQAVRTSWKKKTDEGQSRGWRKCVECTTLKGRSNHQPIDLDIAGVIQQFRQVPGSMFWSVLSSLASYGCMFVRKAV